MFYILLNLSVFISLISLLIDPNKINEYTFLQNMFPNITDFNISDLIIYICLGIFILFTIKNVIISTYDFLLHKITYNIRYKSAIKLFKFYIQNKNYLFHLKNNSSILIRNINASRSIGLMALSIVDILTEFFMLLGLVCFVLYFIEFKFIFFLLVVLIFSFTFYKYFKNKILKWSYKTQEEEKKYLQTLQEGIGSIRDIFILGVSKFFVQRFDKINLSIKNNGIPLSFVPNLSRYVLEVLMIFMFTNILIYRTFVGIDGKETILFLSVIALAVLRILPSINKILTKYQLLNNMSAPVEIAIGEFDQNKVEDVDKEDNRKIIKNFNQINLKNISFSYDKKKLVLQNLNLDIKKNQFIGIYGKSGCGKSTLVDIISGLIQPDSGNILIDNDNYNNKQLNISYISQLNHLIDDTILTNITFEEDENKIDFNKVNDSLKSSELYDFIYSLEKNIYTKIGERGTNISGGQRQRIGIARALYNESETLILDEPTSMLDKDPEEKFIKYLEKIKKNKTIILISHNLNNLRNCDKVYELANGAINQR